MVYNDVAGVNDSTNGTFYGNGTPPAEFLQHFRNIPVYHFYK